MKLSISEAARRAGVRRATLYRKLETGRLSKETGEDGRPVIDLSELARVYPHAVTAPGRTPETDRTGVPNGEVAMLRELVDTLKQDKGRLTRELDRAHVTLEREREEGRKLLAMLDRERQLTLPRADDKRRPQGRGLWAWLTGK